MKKLCIYLSVFMLVVNNLCGCVIAATNNINSKNLTKYNENETIELGKQPIKKFEYSRSIDKTKKDVLKLKVSKTDKAYQELIKIQQQKDMEDIEILWNATVNNNNIIKFALKKITSPVSQQRIHSSLLSKTLSALITGASYVPTVIGADSLIQSASFASGKIAQNFLNRENIKSEKYALSDTELIELASVLENLQNSIISSYYNYKNSLLQIKTVREKMLLYNKNYTEALSKGNKSDNFEVLLSGSKYDDIKVEEIKLVNSAQKYYLELQRLAGTQAISKLNLYQPSYRSNAFEINSL